MLSAQYQWEAKSDIISNIESQYSTFNIVSDNILEQKDYPDSPYKICKVAINWKPDSQKLTYRGFLYVTLCYSLPTGIEVMQGSITEYLTHEIIDNGRKEKFWATDNSTYFIRNPWITPVMPDGDHGVTTEVRFDIRFIEK